TTTRPPIFFAAIRFAASRTVRSGSMTMTLFVITSRTKTMPNPEEAAAPTGARYRDCLSQRASYQSMKASNARTSPPLRGRRSGGRQDLGPCLPLLPWEALAERIQPQSVLAGRVARTTEEGPSVPGATPHETAFRTNGAGPVVLLQERRVSDPTAERGPMRLQFRHDGVESTPGFCHHVLESRMALRNRRHPFFQMAGHLRTRDVRAIDGQGVHEGPSRRGRSHGTACDELPAEKQIQDLMARRLRREESAGDQVVHPRPDAVPPLRRSGGRVHRRMVRRLNGTSAGFQ